MFKLKHQEINFHLRLNSIHDFNLFSIISLSTMSFILSKY